MRRLTSLGLATAVAASLLCVAPIARAQESTAFTLERHRITPDRTGILGVEWGDTLPHLGWDLGLSLTYSDDPLVVRRLDDGTRVGSLLHRRLGGALLGAVGLGGWFQLGFEIPLVLSQDRPDDQPLLAPAPLEGLGGVGFGDVRLLPKIRIVRGLALVLGINLPSGRDAYRGGTALEFAPELAASVRLGRVRMAANVGYRMRDDQSFLDQDVEDELVGRVGLALGLSDAVELQTSLDTATAAAALFEHANQNHLEAQGGLAIAVGPGQVFAGAGAGLNQGYGSPDWRVFGGVRFGVTKRAPAPPREEPTSRPAPVPVVADRDGDGLLDPDDKCPDDPETKNDFEDEDGCPDDDDKDDDGIWDPTDQCVMDPEDIDGFEDTDGCPDVDNDKDGITDTRDRCPNEAGPEINQGCPDTDRDGDGVVDRIDNCPDEPGVAKHKGCKAKQLVSIGAGKLDIVDAVYFKTNSDVIEKRSWKLLDNVAQVIVSHPEVGTIRVEGHTDDRGDDAYNLDLSQRRADSVRTYLVGKGVPIERLVARGFGETQPVQPNTTKKNRATNRRVVFVITSSELKQMESGPGDDTIDR